MYRKCNTPQEPSTEEANWLFPEPDMAGYSETLDEDEEEELDGYCVWTVRRNQFAELLAAWAETVTDDDEMRQYLIDLSKLQVPKEWTIWGVMDADLASTGSGFYLIAPRDHPQAIAVIERKGNKELYAHYLAAHPKELGKGVYKAVRQWIESLKPKQVVIRQPDQLALFGLEVSAAKGAAAKVSKGL